MSRVTHLTARETQPGHWTVTSEEDPEGFLTDPAETYEAALEKIRGVRPGDSSWPTESNDA